MPRQDGYKKLEEIAVETGKSLNRIRTIIRKLKIPQAVFPEDGRSRYYSPQDVDKIKEYLKRVPE